MSYDALHDYPAHHPRRRPRPVAPLTSRAVPQTIIGSIALAFVATTCLWVVYNNVSGPGSEADAAPAPVASADAPVTNVARKSARASVGTSVIQKNYAALLDAGHSLGHPPSTFAIGALPTRADQLALPASARTRFAALQPPAASVQDNVETPPSVVRQATGPSVPLPTPRPVVPEVAQASASAPRALPAPKGPVEDKATVLAAISSKGPSLFQKLFGKPKTEGVTLAYASPDGGIASDAQTIMFDGAPKYDRYTAVYDISARTVYLPDGTQLEAHSGLGKHMDDPRFVHLKMRGATPPHVYDLKLRESLFHGVEAIRMTPVGGDGRIHGRNGLLTHTYMLGPRGDSNGCVSFKDYATFLRAFKSGAVKRLVVVAKLS